MSDEGGIKIICENRKARHNYFIEEKFEAGIVLLGTEVKSPRAGKANLQDAYAIFKNRELFLINANISHYSQASRDNHEPLRTRKLLLHIAELNKLWSKIEIKGYNLVPLKMYFKQGRAKVEIGVGRGKKDYDKRAVTKERESARDLAKLTKKNSR